MTSISHDPFETMFTFRVDDDRGEAHIVTEPGWTLTEAPPAEQAAEPPYLTLTELQELRRIAADGPSRARSALWARLDRLGYTDPVQGGKLTPYARDLATMAGGDVYGVELASTGASAKAGDKAYFVLDGRSWPLDWHTEPVAGAIWAGHSAPSRYVQVRLGGDAFPENPPAEADLPEGWERLADDACGPRFRGPGGAYVEFNDSSRIGVLSSDDEGSGPIVPANVLRALLSSTEP